MLVLVPVAEVVEARALRLVLAFCGDGSGEGEPRDDAVDSLEDLRTTFSSCARPCPRVVVGVLVFRCVRRAGVVGGRGATSSSSSPSVSLSNNAPGIVFSSSDAVLLIWVRMVDFRRGGGDVDLCGFRCRLVEIENTSLFCEGGSGSGSSSDSGANAPGGSLEEVGCD